MIEKFYKRIIDGVPTAIIIVDKNLKVVFTNAAFKKLFQNGKSKGSIGEITRCGEDARTCGRGHCSQGCMFRAAFEDSFYARAEISRRVLMRIRLEGVAKEVAFSLNVKPLGDGLYMGVIDDALEMEISRELQSARSIQQRLLPAGKWAGGKRYSYTYIPCRDIGGDLPEVFAVDGKACGMIADVSGKGISAGMLTAFVKAAYNRNEPSPAAAIAGLSQKFKELNLDERNYITVAAVRIDEDTITYSMAGHNVPILLKSKNGITRVTLNSPPVCNWFDNPSYFEDILPYNKGDILVLLTDGVTECKNARGEMFGVDGAMKTLSVSRTGEEFINNLEKNLRAFCDNLNDDITAIAFDL